MIANLAEGEGEGFEPSGAKSPTRLAVESLKPLGQPSNLEREIRIRTCPVIVADDQSATVQPLWLPRNLDGLHTRLSI